MHNNETQKNYFSKVIPKTEEGEQDRGARNTDCTVLTETARKCRAWQRLGKVS